MTIKEWFVALQWIDIVLLVGILLLFAGLIYLIIKYTKLEFVGGYLGKRKIRLFGILFGSLVVFYLLYNLYEIQPNQWVEISLMAGLVTVTGFYALSAHRQAEEMREQRLGEARPYLLLRLESEFVQWVKEEAGKLADKEFSVTIRNAGKGPAINLWAALWSAEKTYFGDSKGYLAPDEEWQVTISRASTDMVELGIEKEGWLPELRKSIKKEYAGVVAVKYNDIHHRAWVSYLCLERHDVASFILEAEQSIVELKNPDSRSKNAQSKS